MAIAYITEYKEQAEDIRGNVIPVGQEPAQATQKVTFTTTTQSAAFLGDTQLILVTSDTLCYARFGESPTAITAEPTLVPALTPMFFGVHPGDKVAFVT